MFNAEELGHDSCFTKLSDALLISKKYLYNLPCIKIISLALEDAYKDIFIEDATPKWNISLLKEQKTDGDFIGYDILGWDTGGFHSYLCNGLNKDIESKYSLEINDLGLIQNQYSQVKEFAEYIEGQGEPVIWLPFAVYEHSLK